MKKTSKAKNLLNLLEKLPYFNKNTVILFGKKLFIKDNSINVYISRFLKNKQILHLKNGLYVSTVFFNENKKDISYKFFLANIIRRPSYISSWTALQYYSLTTEIINQTISVTTKVTRNYNKKIGNFFYRTIKKDLFDDFNLIEGKFSFYIASPSKALFDLLYFKTNQFKGIKIEDIARLIDEMRIDFDEIKKNEQDKFYMILKKYYEQTNFK
jgi:predicted transcriptional regulator of viral defense system